MKKVLVILAVLAMTGIASAELLTNNSMEAATPDPYGAIIPDGYGLWSDTWAGSWGQIIDGTAHSGLAHMQLTIDSTLVLFQNAYDNGGAGAIGTEVIQSSFWVRNQSDTTPVGVELGFDVTDPGFGGWWGQEVTPFVVPADGQWHQYSASITAWAGSGIKAKVAVVGGGAIDVDDASAILVPEPMTMALLGLGGLFLRRKK